MSWSSQIMAPVLLTGPNWCHAALSKKTIVAILLWPSKSVSGCKEWPVRGRGQGCPIWPPHSDWTVSQSGGGKIAPQRSVCLPLRPESKFHRGRHRVKERDRWWGERGGDATLSLFHSVELGQACSASMFSKQEGRGSSGDAESDAPVSWRTATQTGDRDGSVENNT